MIDAMILMTELSIIVFFLPYLSANLPVNAAPNNAPIGNIALTTSHRISSICDSAAVARIVSSGMLNKEMLYPNTNTPIKLCVIHISNHGVHDDDFEFFEGGDMSFIFL